jgi:hypothetical protein
VEGRTNKDRGRVRRDRSRAPHRKSNASQSGAVPVAAGQLARQLGKQAGEAPALHSDPAEGPRQRKAPSGQPHTWLANAGRDGAFLSN